MDNASTVFCPCCGVKMVPRRNFVPGDVYKFKCLTCHTLACPSMSVKSETGKFWMFHLSADGIELVNGRQEVLKL